MLCISFFVAALQIEKNRLYLQRVKRGQSPTQVQQVQSLSFFLSMLVFFLRLSGTVVFSHFLISAIYVFQTI